MRLDQWLWAVRIFKSRTLASEAIRNGHVRMEGHGAKPSSKVLPGQTIEIQRPFKDSLRRCTLRVLSIPPSRVSPKLVPEFMSIEALPEIPESKEPQWWERFDLSDEDPL